MKKIIAIVSIMVALTSCSDTTNKTHEDWQREHDKQCATHITKFSYEGHSYLLYTNGAHGRGITHDANCQCRKENGCVGYIDYDIWNEAESSGWQEIGDEHYCPDCCEYDEEKDEYVPRNHE